MLQLLLSKAFCLLFVLYSNSRFESYSNRVQFSWRFLCCNSHAVAEVSVLLQLVLLFVSLCSDPEAFGVTRYITHTSEFDLSCAFRLSCRNGTEPFLFFVFDCN